MSRALIASKLIESVRSRAMIPDDISVYSDEAILDILNEEVSVGLLDTLLTLHEENLVTYTDVQPYTESEYKKRIVIPHRAVGSKLRDVHSIVGQSSFELSRIGLDEIGDYNNYPYANYVGSNLFYVEGDEIVIIGPSTGSNTYRLYYHLTPNQLVLENTCAQISAIDTETGVIQFDSIPSTFTSLTQADIVQNNNPNRIYATDIAVSSVSIPTRSLTISPNSLPRRLEVGDWICFPGTTPYVNVPAELQPVLAQRAAVYILEAIGDAQNLQSAVTKLQRMEKAVQKLLDNRVEGANKKIKSRHGFLQNKIGSRNRVRRGSW